MKRPLLLPIALFAILQWTVPLRAEVVGRVILATGESTALRDGKVVPLSRGIEIEDRDVLQTGPATSLQVRFSDESTVALREQSRLAIEDFRYSGNADGQERAVFRLVKGAFRTITGLIGRVDHSRYQVTTPTATVGIRGTMYALGLCEGDCNNADGTSPPDGLYGSVTGPSLGTNKLSIENKAGESIIDQGQHFYVATLNSPPVLLLQPPSFLADRIPGKPTSASAQGQQSGAGGIGSDSRPNSLPLPLEQIGQNTTGSRMISAAQNLGPGGLPVGVVTQAVTFNPIGAAGIVHGQLVWTTSSDMDLHMLTPTSAEVYYANRTVTFSGATARLDADNTVGGTLASPAVENIHVTGTVPAGNYTFFVRNFSGVPTASILKVTGDSNVTGRNYSVPTLVSGQTSGNYIVTRNPNGTASYSP